jgi:hypothetical protein
MTIAANKPSKYGIDAKNKDRAHFGPALPESPATASAR